MPKTVKNEGSMDMDTVIAALDTLKATDLRRLRAAIEALYDRSAAWSQPPEDAPGPLCVTHFVTQSGIIVGANK
jgi:hypothetical protein